MHGSPTTLDRSVERIKSVWEEPYKIPTEQNKNQYHNLAESCSLVFYDIILICKQQTKKKCTIDSAVFLGGHMQITNFLNFIGYGN